MDATEPSTDHQEEPELARVTAEKVIRAYERSVGAVHAVHRPILLEILTLAYEAVIEHAVRKALEQFVLPALLDLPGSTPAFPGAEVEQNPNALDVQPINPEGVKLAGELELNEDGGFNFSR